ncbi:Methyl-accepting chemotaxis protein McpB [Paraliobacillus sp. PM-2]|uniref:methyl-accepting chemotaxis protein n=1 Tax=Paraliobacillus sp. PM-2 TaxID=1462524 RepID=UPI00061CC6BC|nr:methyl-accepting chemotaxis protein [Paraliobacillus sp. PM-2]CQR46330.1 Methyl-accepting chemotaxis protein McpB [Paraliobacillus sp. PM-2]
MRRSVTTKITVIVSLIVFISISILAVINYRSSYNQVLQAAGVELTGCANITTGIINAEALYQLVNGDNNYLHTVEKQIAWTIEHKDIFETHYILSFEGKVVAADEQLKKQGFSNGDSFQIDQEAIDHVKQGHTYYTDVYEFKGMERVTGFAPIYRDHDPSKEVIAINAIDFEGSIVGQRTWEMAKPTILISLLLPILAAMISLISVRKMVHPIRQISQQVNQVANGKLDLKPLTIHTKDELGLLATDINRMTESLHQVIHQVTTNAIQVAATSQQLFASAEETSRSTEAINDAIQEVASGVERQSENTKTADSNLTTISKQAQLITEKIQAVASASNEAERLSQSGRNTVRNTMEQMQTIEDNTTTISNATSQLDRKAKEIDEIITLINAISEQTNLLALNASIEAARAGEHGKGFSIVAEEVRKLAEQTKHATEQVAQLVSEVQEHSQHAVEFTIKGQSSVRNGMKSMKETNEAFEHISTTTVDTTHHLDQLATDVQTFKEQMRKVVKEVNNITVIAQQSSKNADKIASAGTEQTIRMQEMIDVSKELAMISEKLQTSIDMFDA